MKNLKKLQLHKRKDKQFLLYYIYIIKVDMFLWWRFWWYLSSVTERSNLVGVKHLSLNSRSLQLTGASWSTGISVDVEQTPYFFFYFLYYDVCRRNYF